jgi:GxGYxYP putative glycoside hydrolase C-terminal domain/GxGYxY sequence motif in domain of unknown function N-terminal
MKLFACLAVLLALPCSAEITWPGGQLLPVFGEAKRLEVIELTGAPGELRLLSASLQGIVNRTEPRIYLFEPSDEGKETWLKDLKLPYEVHADPLTLVSRFKAELKGMIVYDPDMPDSVNVATTLAGQKDALVVSPELAAKLTAAPYELKVLDDLRGKFKNRLEAYTWQYENLWKNANRRLVVGLSPGRMGRVQGALPGFTVVAEDSSGERGGKNRRARELDLTGQLGKEAVFLRFEDARRWDGWGPALHRVIVKAGDQVIADFVPGTDGEKPFLHDPQRSVVKGGLRFADNDRNFTYRFAPPAGTSALTATVDVANQFRVSAGNAEPRLPWSPYGHLRDYAVANRAMVVWLDANAPAERELLEKILRDAGPGTPYLGWFGNDIEGEFGAVELTSRHGVYVVPADWFNNLTVFSGTRLATGVRPATPPPALENKIHVTLTFGEGDNLQYNQHRMRVLWDDPARGKVPINWTSTPLLLDAAPAILDHYRRTATDNDLLVSGPSSVGYFYADPWPGDHFPAFLKSTRSYVERSGMNIPYVLNRVNHRDVPLSEAKAAVYRDQHRAPGILLGWGNHFGDRVIEGLPVSEIRGIGTVEEGQRVLAEARKNWDGKSPLFLSVGLFAWQLKPSDVVRLVESLGPEFKVVRADHYFALLRQARGLEALER